MHGSRRRGGCSRPWRDLDRRVAASTKSLQGPIDVALDDRGHRRPRRSKDRHGRGGFAIRGGPLDDPNREGRERRIREPRADRLDRPRTMGCNSIAPLDAATRCCHSGLDEERRELHQASPATSLRSGPPFERSGRSRQSTTSSTSRVSFEWSGGRGRLVLTSRATPCMSSILPYRPEFCKITDRQDTEHRRYCRPALGSGLSIRLGANRGRAW